MKRSYLFSLAIGVSASAVVLQSCSSDLSGCADSRTCAAHGGGGGASGGLGSSGASEGGVRGIEDSGGSAGAAVAGEAGAAGAGGGGPMTPGITLSSDPIARVVQGGTVQIPVTLTRTAFAGPVKVSIAGLPTGVGATIVTAAPSQPMVQLSLTALVTASVGGPVTVTIKASGGSLTAEASLALYVTGKPGELDSSFGTNATGQVTQSISGLYLDDPAGVAIDSSGRIVVAGSGQDNVNLDLDAGWVARFDPAGRLDSAFGANGKVKIAGAPRSALTMLALSKDRPVVAADICCTNMASFLRRFTEQGTVDTSYGTGGDVLIGSNQVQQLVTWNDGTLIFSGGPPTSITAAGQQDPSFAPPATLTAWFGAVDSKNNLAVALSSATSFNLARLTPNGSLDPGFGNAGNASFPVPVGNDLAAIRQIAVDQNDAVLILAESRFGKGDYLQNEVDLVRFTAQGVLDHSFGSGKVVITPAGIALHALVQSDDAVLALYANRIAGPTTAFALSRYTSAGVLDESFAKAGVLDLAKLLPGYEPRAIAYDPFGNRLVVVGWAPDQSQGVLLLRIWL